MTTYVFFIGGTGARVLRSLTMLLASGVSIGENNKIIPIIIDYDAENGDLLRSLELLESYNKLHNTAKYNNDERGFFRTPIEVNNYSMVNIKLDENKSTFADFIGWDTLDEETRLFLRTLYDDSSNKDPKTELNLKLDLGFKGNPNIGSVVFNDYFRQKEYGYADFHNSLPAKGDMRVFIVGSIFGGTGSSGLPQLVKKFRNSDKPALKLAPLGACVVLPYFKVSNDTESAINSDTFYSKSKAALTYYEKEINKKMTEIYYIGCDKQENAYANEQGGKAQSNDAHLVELLSAMSIVEFAKRKFSDENIVDNPTYYEYTTSTGIDEQTSSLKKGTSYLDLLGTSMQNDINIDSVYSNYVRHMNAFAYFSKYCMHNTYGEGLKSPKDEGGFLKGAQGYYKELKNGIAKGTDFGNEMLKFQHGFIAWAEQMEANQQLHFDPYEFAQELENVLNVNDGTTKVKGIEDCMQKALQSELNRIKVSTGIPTNGEGAAFIRIGSVAGLAAADKINNK